MPRRMEQAEEVKRDFLKNLFEKEVFPTHGPAVIAGPCSAESEEQILQSAKELTEIGIRVFRAGAWKPRTTPGGFEGYGEDALRWLAKAKSETGILIGTEVGTAAQAKLALDYDLDFVWIGARTTASPFAVEEIGRALKGKHLPIFLKNPIAPDLSLWHGALLRLHHLGLTKVVPILRGFRLGDKGTLRNSPMWYLMREFRKLDPTLPIFCDPSHIAGSTELLPEVIREASLQDYDGLLIESHPHPDKALTDARQQITAAQLQEILKAWDSPGLLGKTPLYDFRQHLRVIDNEIIRLLAEREYTSEQIGMWKHENDIESYQPDQRERMETERNTFAQEQGTDPTLVHRIFDLIHKDSVDIQEQIKKKDK